MRTRALAALFAGAASLLSSCAWAASCCGGGGGGSQVLPRNYKAMVDVSVEVEKYDGFWNEGGKHTPDPPGSDLRQYRLNVGYAHRLSTRWQTGIVLPFVWNDNTYSGVSSRSQGLGDTTMNLWYEALEEIGVWSVRTLGDLMPSLTIGPSLLLPTGVSPYDDVGSSFDVTGRGFYRLDGNLLIDKTLHPWTASVSLGYGTYLERSVNQEYGKFVEPYRKKLGDRSSVAASLGYIYYLGTAGDTLTGTASLSHLREADGTLDGERDPTTGFRKTSLGGALTYSSTDDTWSVKAAWSRAIQRDGWGANFPTTDIYTLGVRYGFR